MIKFPEYFDTPKVLNAFKTLNTQELYAFFDCNSRQAFTGMMKKYFPNKPSEQSYSKYVKSLLEQSDPSMQQAEPVVAEPVQPKTSKSFLKATGGGVEQIQTVLEPVEVPQPRIRTELDIWTSKQLFKDAGRTTQNQWLKAGHPDPNLETEENPYAEVDVFTKFS